MSPADAEFGRYSENALCHEQVRPVRGEDNKCVKSGTCAHSDASLHEAVSQLRGLNPNSSRKKRSMLKIVIPMAGRGSRFADAGYKKPKPLIDLFGRPMISWVIDNLRPAQAHQFIFVCQASHVAEYGLKDLLREYAPGCEIVAIEGITEGAACTVLCAQDFIDECPLMLANSDQYVDYDIDKYLAGMGDADGLIMTMYADDPKWSFAELDDEGDVVRVVEKEVISNEATVGIYNFARGTDFVRAAQQMIGANLRVNNEFYVAPTYNQIILAGATVRTHSIGSEAEGMYGLGTPEDLELFQTLPVSQRLRARSS